MKPVRLALVVALGINAWTAELASAQLAIGGSSSNYGSVNLAPGFTPDPRQVSVTSGGSLDVNDMKLGDGCVGYATRQPDYIVHLSGSSSRLRFYAEADGDTGLIINSASGGWHCNDDSYGGTNPTVTINNASSGQYDVWVTSYSSGDNIHSTLYITELDRYPGWGGGSGGDGGNGRLSIGGDNSNFGTVSLSPGFTPDPYTVSVTSGGSHDVRDMNLGSGCVGYATRQPDFILDMSGSSSMLRIYMVGDGDTGLVINDPSGEWHCNDDSYGGTNPTVTMHSTSSGQYDIWVTSYSSGDNISGTLHITELDSRHPN